MRRDWQKERERERDLVQLLPTNLPPSPPVSSLSSDSLLASSPLGWFVLLFWYTFLVPITS